MIRCHVILRYFEIEKRGFRQSAKPPVFPQRFIEKINLAEVLLQILPLSGRATSLCRIQILADFQQIQ